MDAHNSWESLPSIIIVEILSYLDLTDRLNATISCKRWRTCLFQAKLWQSVDFKLKYGNRKSSRFLSEICGRFVREATVEFTSQNVQDLKESVRLLEVFGRNSNIERLVLKPSSCLIAWPERHSDRMCERFLAAIEDVIRNARHLKHLSLGCIGELADHADQLLYLLQVKHFASLKALHISSVKEDPDSYGLIDIPAQTFHLFRNLSTLGIDYDYLSNQLLEGFVQGEKTRLEKLILHIHGVNAENEKILNTTWLKLVQANPNFEVTVNMIHSFDGSICMLDILQPALPLAHLRMFFCQQINEAAINFLSRHMANRLRSIYIIDGMEDGQPNVYDITTDEDPFVMLAWKCPNLNSFTLIGYEMCEDDIIAIARLRGSQLSTFDVPWCCVSQAFDYEDEFPVHPPAYGQVSTGFIEEVSASLLRTWQPVPDNKLHPAVLDPLADAEVAYLSILHADQE